MATNAKKALNAAKAQQKEAEKSVDEAQTRMAAAEKDRIAAESKF